MTQFVYAATSAFDNKAMRATSAAGFAPYAPSLAPLASFRLPRLTILSSSRPERWLAAVLIVTLHAVVLTLLARSADAPIALPPQPQPASVELVAAAPVIPPPQPTEAEAEPDAPQAVTPPPPTLVEEVQPVAEEALQPAQPKKPPAPAPRKTALARPKPVATPRPAPTAAAANVAPNTPAPAAATATNDAPLTPPLANADYLHNPPPPYPDVAISRGQEGTVLLNVQVRPDGKVQTLNIQKSSGYPALDNAARDTVLRWSFVPARRGSQTVSGWVIVPVDFSLNS